MSTAQNAETNISLLHPYCGNCGHVFLSRPAIALADARNLALTLRCQFCSPKQTP